MFSLGLTPSQGRGPAEAAHLVDGETETPSMPPTSWPRGRGWGSGGSKPSSEGLPLARRKAARGSAKEAEIVPPSPQPTGVTGWSLAW